MTSELTAIDLKQVEKLARSLARKVAARLTVDWEDLYQEGLAALVVALPRFDGTRGTWEGFRRQCAYHGMAVYLRCSHIGPHRMVVDSRTARYTRARMERGGVFLSRAMLAEALGWTIDRVERAELGLVAFSLEDSPDSGSPAHTWTDLLAANEPSPEEEAIHDELLAHGRQAITQLRPKLSTMERKVLDGLLCGETQAKIANLLRISEVYTQQIARRIRLRLAATVARDGLGLPPAPSSDREQTLLALLQEKARPLHLLMRVTGWSEPIAKRLVRDLIARGLAWPAISVIACPDAPTDALSPREAQLLALIQEQDIPRTAAWYAEALGVSRPRIDQLTSKLRAKRQIHPTGSIVLTPAGEAFAAPALTRSAA